MECKMNISTRTIRTLGDNRPLVYVDEFMNQGSMYEPGR